MIVAIPVRQHKCELCGAIFDCLACLEAMLDSDSDNEGTSLYAPVHGGFVRGKHRQDLRRGAPVFLCENCCL